MVKLVLHACKTDDVSLMAHVVWMATQDDSEATVQDVLQKALTRPGKKVNVDNMLTIGLTSLDNIGDLTVVNLDMCLSL